MRSILLPTCIFLAAAGTAQAQETSSQPDLSWIARHEASAEPLGGVRSNPSWEWGALADLIAEFSEADGLERVNELRARSLALHGAVRLEDFGRAYAVVDFSGGGDGSDLVLREAAAWLDLLPFDANLRFGKFFADVGGWNRVHLSEFPGPNMDGLRRDYFGGNMAVTGIELHQSFDYGGDGFRWSLGMSSDREGQDPDTVGNGVADSPNGTTRFGRDGLDTWMGTGRVEFGWKGADDTMTLGASAVYAPDELYWNFVDPDGNPTSGDEVAYRDELRDLLAGLDFRYHKELAGDAWHAATAEVWLRRNQHRMSTGPLETRTSVGAWGMYEMGLDARWSGGYLVSFWEASGFDAEDEAHYHGAFLTYAVADGHRARVFFNHTNPGFGLQKYYVGGIQYTFHYGAPRRSALLW
jgi:hypothetical protein